MTDKIIFVTGIDTGCGKTFVTGLLARYLLGLGGSVITQKLVQTGAVGVPDDIRQHRRLMGRDLGPEDLSGLTCPYVFAPPASPHLAARLAGVRVETARLDEATRTLAATYDRVVIEGVGGLCVPLNESCTVLDFVAERGYPVVLVSSPRLGSINHTLLSLEAMRRRGVSIVGMAYNLHFQERVEIVEDSRRLFQSFLAQAGCPAAIVDIPAVNADAVPDVDFGAFFRPRALNSELRTQNSELRTQNSEL